MQEDNLLVRWSYCEMRSRSISSASIISVQGRASMPDRPGWIPQSSYDSVYILMLRHTFIILFMCHSIPYSLKFSRGNILQLPKSVQNQIFVDKIFMLKLPATPSIYYELDISWEAAVLQSVNSTKTSGYTVARSLQPKAFSHGPVYVSTCMLDDHYQIMCKSPNASFPCCLQLTIIFLFLNSSMIQDLPTS